MAYKTVSGGITPPSSHISPCSTKTYTFFSAGLARSCAALFIVLALGSCVQPFNVIRERASAPTIVGTSAAGTGMWRLLLSRPYPEDYKIQAATDKDFRNLLRVYMAGNTVYVEGEELELIYLRVTDPSSIAGPSDIVAFNVNSGGAVDLSKTWEDVLAQISEAGNGITNVINLYGQYWDLEFDEGSLPGGLGGFTNPFQGITITSGSIQELKIRSNHVTLRDCDVTNLTIYGNNVRVFDSYGKNVSVESSVTVPVKFFDCLIDQLWGGTRTDLVGTVVYFPY